MSDDPVTGGRSAAGAAPLEKSLELLIERLTASPQTARVRALRIEALRLKSIMGNWRSIPPLPEVREAMLARVLHVCSAAGDLPLDDLSSTPPPARTSVPPPPQVEVVEAPPSSDQREMPEEAEAILEPADEVDAARDSAARRAALTGPGHFRHRPRSDAFPDDAFDEPEWARGGSGRGGGWGPGPGWGVGFVASNVPELPAPPPTTVEVHILRIPDEIDERLAILREPTSKQADAFRALRQRLSQTGDPKTIAVSSARRGEGKTTTAANLALAYREIVRGGRVLLMEANVRRPNLAKLFGFSPPICFLEQLKRHKNDPNEPWIAVEQIAPLHVMAVDPDTTRETLLDPVAFSIAMDRLSLAGYDYIVIDTPSILEGADVNLMTESVEGVLLSTRSALTTEKALRRAIEQLGPVTVFGAVMLDVPASSTG